MPQLDKFIFSPFYFWLALLFGVSYLLFVKWVLPRLLRTLKFRRLLLSNLVERRGDLPPPVSSDKRLHPSVLALYRHPLTMELPRYFACRKILKFPLVPLGPFYPTVLELFRADNPSCGLFLFLKGVQFHIPLVVHLFYGSSLLIRSRVPLPKSTLRFIRLQGVWLPNLPFAILFPLLFKYYSDLYAALRLLFQRNPVEVAQQPVGLPNFKKRLRR